MKLGNILDLKSPTQNERFESTGKVYQIEFAVISVKDVCKVEISMAISCLMELLHEVRQSGDERSSQLQVLASSFFSEMVGQPSFQRLSVRNFLGNYEVVDIILGSLKFRRDRSEENLRIVSVPCLFPQQTNCYLALE